MFWLATALVSRLIVPLLLTGVFTQTPGGRPVQPQAEWALADAPIQPILKKWIMAKLNKTGEFSDGYPAANARVKFVRLDGQGRAGVQVWGSCGNRYCLVWIFDNWTGDLLVSSSGYEYDFRHTRHHGLFDFYVLEHMDNKYRRNYGKGAPCSRDAKNESQFPRRPRPDGRQAIACESVNSPGLTIREWIKRERQRMEAIRAKNQPGNG
jgi:hypothetical protein